jgi:hypothetical protein
LVATGVAVFDDPRRHGFVVFVFVFVFGCGLLSFEREAKCRLPFSTINHENADRLLKWVMGLKCRYK